MTTAAATPPPPSAAENPGSLEAADAALQKMDWGAMAFNVPQTLRVEQTALIQLLISPTQTAEQLTAAIREQTTEPVKIESASVQISGMMEAKLVGSAFEIRPITPEEPQMVSRQAPTEWKWEVRSRSAGRQSLHLMLNAIVRFEGKERPRVVRTFDRVIEVEVAPPAAPALVPAAAAAGSGNAPPWVWPAAGATAALALGGAAWQHWRRRRPMAPVTAAVVAVAPNRVGSDLFLSYSRKDQARVLPLAESLRASGLTVWIDQGGIEGATLWAQEISEAIRQAKVCVLCASRTSFASPHVTREVSLACEEGKPILPLYLEPVETPSTMRYQLAGIQHIALHGGDPATYLEAVLRALARMDVRPPGVPGEVASEVVSDRCLQ